MILGARLTFQAVLGNLNPWATATRVNYGTSSADRCFYSRVLRITKWRPAGVRESYRKYNRSEALTDFREFPGRSHLLIAQTGWQEVAAYALSWAKAKAAGVGMTL